MVEYISLRARTRRSRALHGSIFASASLETLSRVASI